MVFRRLIAWFFRLPARRAKAVRIHPARLAMEVLEDRAVPASHTLAIVSPELMGRVPAAESSLRLKPHPLGRRRP